MELFTRNLIIDEITVNKSDETMNTDKKMSVKRLSIHNQNQLLPILQMR